MPEVVTKKDKTCTKCGFTKPIGEFYNDKTRDDGKFPQCKLCCRQYDLARKDKQLERINNLKNSRRRWLYEYRETLACEMCGEDRGPTLDFHHRNPEEKEYDVSTMVDMPKDVILAEIEKCMVLCSNCHRLLHWQEGNRNGNRYQ